MIRISETIAIAAPAQQVWTILHDAAAVAQCIPGAELKAEKTPGLYEATISVKFGPTVAHFAGEGRVEYDEGGRRVTVSGRGNDRRGSSPITGSGAVNVLGAETTELQIDGSFEISGPLESFVETGGVFVARALLAQFAENLSELVQARHATPNETGLTPAQESIAAPEPAAPISAAGLLLTIAKNSLRGLLLWVTGRKK